MFVILTWSGERKIYDAGLITGADGEARTFETAASADDWCNDNDGELGTFSKVIDLDA